MILIEKITSSKISPETDIFHNECLELIEQNNYKKALESINKAIDISSQLHHQFHFKSSNLFTLNGDAYFYDNNLAMAKCEYDKAIFQDHLNCHAHLMRSKCNNNKLQDYEKAIEINNKYGNEKNNLNNYSLGNLPIKISIIDEINNIQLQHQNYHNGAAMQHLSRAYCYYFLAQLDCAMMDLNKATDLDASINNIYIMRLQINLEKNNFLDAISDYQLLEGKINKNILLPFAQQIKEYQAL
jgi:tetratricopeptide (TPR) repeat protein